MVSIIKNQLLKHLSIYTKNLSSDKINLSTFRGEGELSNLQLDEAVLTELLELPAWLRLTSAWCNHVSFRISWTKLKTVPILLTIDEINITVETCDPSCRSVQMLNGNVGNNSGNSGSMGTSLGGVGGMPQGRYNFIHKVVDGISIIVNTVNVKFLSAAFKASVQMSRIRIESKTPKWVNGDLPLTRLKDAQRGILLIFKEMSWQTVRIEASSTQDKSLTPLRLLTNQARCRITIRKRLSDSSLLASRLVLILDDLLWVLTDSQLKAALHFVNSLFGLIKSATHATQKSSAARKLETLPEYQAQLTQQQVRQADTIHTSASQKMFNAFDVQETSYHFFSQRIDLHLCDDEGDGRSSYPELKKGGALQISIQALQIDYYPYHLAKSDRTHWPKYREASAAPAIWLKDSLNAFYEAVTNLSQPNRVGPHTPLGRSTPNSPITLNVTALASQYSSNIAGNRQSSSSTSTDNNTPTQIDNLEKLMSSCVILRVEDFQLFHVTTAGRKQIPKEFISGDKDRYSLPAEIPVIHLEFTYFYYPGDFIFPLPPPKIFVHINPVVVHFDIHSLLWFNSFALNLYENLLRTNFVNLSNNSTEVSALSSPVDSRDSPSTTLKGSSKISLYNLDGITRANNANNNEPSLMYMDFKLEAIMLRVVIESAVETLHQKDRPKTMQIQVSRVVLTNIREMGSSRADLAEAIHSLQEGSLIFGNDFPSVNGDTYIVTDRILQHVAAKDVYPVIFNNDDSNTTTQADLFLTPASKQCLTRYAMWTEPRDVWCIKLDPVWIDFLGAPSLGTNKAIPFIDAVPITLWLHFGASICDLTQKRKRNEDGSSVNNSASGPHFLESAVKNSGYFIDSNNYQNRFANVDNSNCPKRSQNPFLDSPEDLQLEDKSQNSFLFVKNERTTNVHVIAHISNMISLQIDHYQYLFLLRLAEDLTEMATFLSIDAERILKQDSFTSMIFGCVIPQVEITFIMPSTTPGKESSGGDVESVVPDSASLGDDLHVNNANIMLPQAQPHLDHIKNNTSGNTEMSSLATNEKVLDSGIHFSSPNIHGTCQISTKIDTDTYTQSVTSSSTKNCRLNRNSTSDTISITREINSGLMSMKKGFSSFMTSIDSAMTSTRIVTTNEDISDAFSIPSDISSDSENFANFLGDDKTMDCIDVMFRLNPFNTDSHIKTSPVEVASEVYEEVSLNKTNLSSPSEPSEASIWRRRDLVSMATFRLTTVEVIRQIEGNNDNLRVQVTAVSCDECNAIPWDELQTKFGARCKVWNVAPHNPESLPCIRLRLESNLNPPKEKHKNFQDKHLMQSWASQNAEVRISDVSLDLNMSTIIGLTDLIEDEVINSNPLVLNVTLENVHINLIEDRPPINITSPGPNPLNLAIGRMVIKRDKNGVLHLQPIDTNINGSSNLNDIFRKSNHSATYQEHEHKRDREILSLQLVNQQIKLDNDNLRKQLQIAKENDANFRQKSKKESELLRLYLRAAQDDINILLEEKKALMDTIRSLQTQVTSMNMNKQMDANTSLFVYIFFLWLSIFKC